MEIDSFRCQNSFQVHTFSVRDFVGKVKDFILYFYIFGRLRKTDAHSVRVDTIIVSLQNKPTGSRFLEFPPHISHVFLYTTYITVFYSGSL